MYFQSQIFEKKKKKINMLQKLPLTSYASGFFLLIFCLGDSKFLVPVGPRRGPKILSRMGGGNLQKKLTEAKTVHLMQN